MNLQTLHARVARARSAIGKGTRYRLGKGGFDPRAPHPGRECDCSGFVAWCLMIGRAPKGGRPFWIETTSISRDARSGGQASVFVEIERPVPGCLAVYGDRIQGGRVAQGHVGLVSEVRSESDWDVVDCSASSWRTSRDAIRERSGTPLRARGAIFCLLREDL